MIDSPTQLLSSRPHWRSSQREQLKLEAQTVVQRMSRLFTDTAAQETIDKEIAVINATLRSLKTRRNTLSAIAHLPDEILAIILLEFQSMVQEVWPCINEVCTHWRHVALNTPHLWTEINLNSVRRADYMLQRAKSAPLVVTCHWPCPWGRSDVLWSLVTRLMGPECRLRELDLTLLGQELQPLIQFLGCDSIESQGPHIQHLSIYSRHDVQAMESLGGWVVLPKLISLRFSIPLPVQMPMLPRLTFLQLRSQGLAVSSVLRAFACMPAVQDVVIENLFNDNEAAPTLPVVLRALICLSINFLDSPSSRIFASLDLPRSAYIQVCFACLVGQASEIPDISALAVRFHEFIGPKNINTRDITLGIDCTTFELWIPSAEDSGGLALNGKFTRPDAVLPLFNALTETFTSLTYDIVPNTNFGNMLFLRLVHLKHLKLSTKSPRSDTMILTLLLKAPRDAFPLLPNLESLSGDFHTQDQVEALETLLQDRRELGIPIQTISTSKVHEGAVSHLKEEYGVILDFT